VLRSSGEVALCVREDSAEVHELKNPSRIRKEKLRRSSAFSARSYSSKERRGRRTL
jgi:hypothetical protein